MKIATWNVNSIRSRVDRVLDWTRREQPDVLCLQEIKTTDELFPAAPFEELGYHVETCGQPTYNGVAILSRTRLSDVARGLPGDDPDAQRRLIAATVAGVRIVNVYVPNGQSPESEKFVYKLEWLGRLRDFLRERPRRQNPCCSSATSTSRRTSGTCTIRSSGAARSTSTPRSTRPWRGSPRWGLFDLFRKHHTEGGLYSWWDYRQLAFQKNNGLRIDLVLGTAPMLDRCKGSAIHRDERKGEGPSDHVPVVVEI